MDEIFGEDNFVACLVRTTKTGGERFGKQFIQKDFDYLICFVHKNYYWKWWIWVLDSAKEPGVHNEVHQN